MSGFAELPNNAAIAELKAIPQWVGWKYKDRGGAKPTKPPINPHTGGLASTDNPATWGTCEQAESRAKIDKLAGVGFALSEKDNLTGYDFDNCFTRKGRIKDWLADILVHGETYAEVSPSGKGIRMIARGKIAAALKCDAACVEVYGRGRYFTITGQGLKDDMGLGENVPILPIGRAPQAEIVCRDRVKLHSETWKALKKAGPAIAKAFEDGGKNHPLNTSSFWKKLDEDTPSRRTPDAKSEPKSEPKFSQLGEGESFFRKVNDAALKDLARWVPAIFGNNAVFQQGTGAYRLSSKALKRNYQEDLAIHPGGVQDWGSRRGLTPIDVVVEWGNESNPTDAAMWLCRQLGSNPADLGWQNGEAEQEVNVVPIDIWGTFNPPELPRGVLPQTIEDFAFTQSELMGADPAGLAMAALTCCAAAIADSIKLKVKRHDSWCEAARLWTALIGEVSAMKTPIMGAATYPIRRIDRQLLQTYQEAHAVYDVLSKEERAKVAPPRQHRLELNDTTVEAAQEAFLGSPDGLLCNQDELSGWFGSMDKYTSGGRGAAKDRAFWLQAYNGGSYGLNRISRGVSLIPNLSACVLGGIQPALIRMVVAEAVDDGLIQRLIPVVLRPAKLGKDVSLPDAVKKYTQLVEALHKGPMIGSAPIDGISVQLTFSEGAHAVRQRTEKRHLELVMACETINRKLAGHIGKYNEIFARLCIVWHRIEHAHSYNLEAVISEQTALRVESFLHRFLLQHALAFYVGMLGMADNHDRLVAVAGYILSRKLKKITRRDVAHGDRTMRGLEKHQTDIVLDQLEALGWLFKDPPIRTGGAPHWHVNPEVHARFAERGKMEAERRSAARKMIAEILSGAEIHDFDAAKRQREAS
jgi:hypothetical protein